MPFFKNRSILAIFFCLTFILSCASGTPGIIYPYDAHWLIHDIHFATMRNERFVHICLTVEAKIVKTVELEIDLEKIYKTIIQKDSYPIERELNNSNSKHLSEKKCNWDDQKYEHKIPVEYKSGNLENILDALKVVTPERERETVIIFVNDKNQGYLIFKFPQNSNLKTIVFNSYTEEIRSQKEYQEKIKPEPEKTNWAVDLFGGLLKAIIFFPMLFI